MRLALALLVLAACGNSNATRSPTSEPSASATAESKPDAAIPMGTFVDASAPVAITIDAGSVVPSWRSSISFSNITGRSGDQTAAIFTPQAGAIEGCRGASGGKLVIKLHSEGPRLVAEPQAGSSVDPSAQKCVLDALSKVHLEDASNVGAAAPVKPMGFTSLLTIEW